MTDPITNPLNMREWNTYLKNGQHFEVAARRQCIAQEGALAKFNVDVSVSKARQSDGKT
jgi:hypothetical protein